MATKPTYEELERTIRLLKKEGSDLKRDKGASVATETKMDETSILKGKESEQKYRALIDTMNEGLVEVDENWNIIFINRRFEEMIGYSSSQLIGRPFHDFVKETYALRAQEEHARRRRGETGRYELELVRGDGEAISVFCSPKPYYDPDGRYLGGLGIVADITKQKAAEKELRESEEKYRSLFENAPMGICILDDEGNILDFNDAMLRLHGCSREDRLAIGFTIDYYYNPEDRKDVIANLTKDGSVNEMEVKFKRKDGTPYDVLLSVLPIEIGGESLWQAIIQDISERKQAEKKMAILAEKLRQSQKMEAIGTLTGGIAHDYNNLMSIIMGNLSLAMDEAEAGSLLAYYLNEVNTASRKVRDLTHELMALSRGGAPVKKIGSLKEPLESALAVIPADGGISVEVSISRDLRPVPHDPHKMGAVFRNVLTNAVEAMPDGGTLKIKGENVRIRGETRDPGLPLKPGHYVNISIEDRGRGIPQDHLEKIFDPYFSTKVRGVEKGMGLGLTTAYAIVQKHGGHIAVDSTVETGTTMDIYLPAGREPLKVHGKTPSESGFPSTTKRVLVMDDEEMLRKLAELMLKRLGYAVETVKDGFEAVEAYKRRKASGEPFDAVILDLTIKGGMGGEQTMGELRKIDPHIKAIVCSGYFNDPVMAHYEERGFRGALAKPYHNKDLESVLKKVLG